MSFRDNQTVSPISRTSAGLKNLRNLRKIVLETGLTAKMPLK
jgi:hypothetical protein